MAADLQGYLHAPDEDLTDIQGMLDAACRHVEERTQRQFLEAEWKLYLDRFPYFSEMWGGTGWSPADAQFDDRAVDRRRGVIELRMCPLLAVTEVKYIDADGVEQVMDEADYDVDLVSEPGRLMPAFGTYWPVTRIKLNAVTITFSAGYPSSSLVPPQGLQAIRLLTNHWYDNRDLFARGAVDPLVSQLLNDLLSDLRWTL
jgi:hypothetical protein